MHNSIVVCVLAAFAVVALPAAHLIAAVIPPIGLAPGSQYQLIFVTAGTHDALSSDITDYNTFVSNEAALNPSLPTGVTWAAVASTDAVNANANALSGGLPVYNTAGQQEADAMTGIYGGSLFRVPSYDQYGNVQSSQVWTGSDQFGIGFPTRVLGSPDAAIVGISFLDDSSWLVDSSQFTSGVRPLYALSSPITVPTPEPTTLTLLGSALFLIGGHRFVRWRRRRDDLGSALNQ